MSKVVKKANEMPKPQHMMSVQEAIQRLCKKLSELEARLDLNLKQIENKVGDQDSFLSNNTPDLDLINQAFADINSRLIDCESLEARVANLETASGAVVSAPKKMRGTVKLDLEQKKF
jgi:hypothetical protein